MAGLPAHTSLQLKLQQWAISQPTKTLYTYHNDDGKAIASVTYSELEKQTRALAAAFLHHPAGLKAGDRVLLVFLPSLDFIISFLACLRAGLIAVPVYPPDPRRVRAYISAFSQTASSCNARVAISHAGYLSSVSLANLRETAVKYLSFGRAKESASTSVADAWPDITWIDATLTLKESSGHVTADTDLDSAPSDAVAFLQYTSGSTSEPKGVMITHGNLAHNLHTIVQSLEAGTDTVVASWLPQYHDMGLIGSLLGVLYCGGSGAYMSPLSFIKRPAVWIELISQFRATHIQAPNFGFQLVARKWKALPKPPRIDLSSLKHAFNAAEPINPVSIQEFCHTFGPHGFAATAMKPGYGLAEHCVYVSDGGTCVLRVHRREFEEGRISIDSEFKLVDLQSMPAERSSSNTLDFVSCGPVAPFASKNPDIWLQLVDPVSSVVVDPHTIGEVWISSPSVAQGYWGQPDLTRDTFHARTVSTTSPNETAADSSPYLRTGDLAFVHNGELFICGRAKDLIILRGKNYFPQDIEAVVEANAALRPGCSAAFQAPLTPGGEDGLIIVAEARDPAISHDGLKAIVESVRTNTLRDAGIAPAAVVVLKAHTARKTTSGKIARKWNKQAFLQMDSDPSSPWHSATGAVLVRWKDDGVASDPVGDIVEISETSESRGAEIAGRYSTLEGEALSQQLRRDVAQYMRAPLDAIPTHVGLSHIGMDSLTLSQLSGSLASQYGFHIKDEHMFADGLSVAWMVENAAALRESDSLVPPHVGVVATTAGDATNSAVAGTAGTRAPPVAAITLPRRNDSWFQRNCPCCVWCY